MPIILYIKSYYPKLFSALKTLRSLLSSIMAQDDQPPADPPPPFDPLKPAIPISYPLKTLDELESRAYFKSFHFLFNESTVKIPDDPLPKRPKNLVCHDMAGGYTADDRFVQGGDNAGAYSIWHWYLIDIFVYFSHSLVTLPPPCWTNAAHLHGVKVLGTFIMEWDEGKILANQLLETKSSAQMYAERLSELAVALGFDGWLINMEVALKPEQIPNLKEFVSHLNQTMHSSLPGSLVIWYDSVTIDGDLSWQNQLNNLNKPFFDLCDGIFVNYTWQKDYPKSSADVAGERKFDVYMGIDVFGRGTYGDGKWTTNVALDVIKEAEVSAAIFAPGWVYETNQPPDFQTAQNRWWGLVEKSWGTVQNYPNALPFYSNFNQGHGYHISVDGEEVSAASWNNISSQSFQPFIEYPEDSSTQLINISVNFKKESYSGGGNITFSGTLSDTSQFVARLFKGELILGNSPLHFTYSVKSSGNSQLGLALIFSSATEEEKSSAFLAAAGNTLITMNQFARHYTKVIMPNWVTKLDRELGWVIQESSIKMDGHILKEIHAVCYSSEPQKSIVHAPSEYYSVLGDIKISAIGENSGFPPAASWTVDNDSISWSSDSEGSKLLSAKINWKLKDGSVDVFSKYNIYVHKLKSSSTGELFGVEYLGVAIVKSFYISDLEVPSGTSSLKFVIQVCGHDGACQKLDAAPFYLLPVQTS